MNLFSAAEELENKKYQPLAERMRPQKLEDFVGQEEILQGSLGKMILAGQIPSMIFFGAPGTGKTSLAKIIANTQKNYFVKINAALSGISELRGIVKEAADRRSFHHQNTILFIDEIHRFNKSQQDFLLPYVEDGRIILIGATTENPSFEVNNALLSRCRVFVLKELTKDDIVKLLKRALYEDRGLGKEKVKISDKNLELIAAFSNGDARCALVTLDMIVTNGEEKNGEIIVSEKIIEECISKKNLLYDKDGEEHYNIISALHKSMRNSDPDAAVYWLARMLEAGEDPLYVARRIVRFASEDIGLADTNALNVAINVYNACHFLGMPECNVHLTEAVIYMSIAPKSNACYNAYLKASSDAKKMLAEPVPLVIRNAPTKLMQELDYGKGYEYAHLAKDKLTTMECLPPSLIGTEYYEPTTQGNESKFKERLDTIKKWKKDHKKKS